MSKFSLRRAQPTDAGPVGAILSEFIDETPWMPRIHTRAEDLSFAGDMIERGWVTVAQEEGEILGFMARDCTEIHALYVTGSAQGMGCGAVLLRAAKEAVPKLSLWTFEANTGAQRFYLRNGFAEAERTDGAGNDEKLPDIRFVWERKS